MDSVAAAFRKLRSELGLTQPAFANRLGLSVRAIAYYEKDREPSGDVLRRLGSLAARNARDDLAKVFYDAYERELQGRTTPSTSAENAWVQAILLVIRNREIAPQVQRISAELGDALESLASSARKRSAREDRARVDQALVEFRYHTAPNAETKIEELARARSVKTGEPVDQARGHVILERPDLYADYLEDRAAAAKGTSFEHSMARGRKKV